MTRRLILLISFLVATVTANAGAWGYGSFENDTALDWVENSLKRRGDRAVERTIDKVAKSRGYLDASAGSEAIAACEVLAAAQGRPSTDLPPEVAALANRLSAKPSESLRNNARAALERVLGDKSELRELWQDAGDNFIQWKKAIAELKSRI